ncbi:MAG TPA: tRNA (N6-threonylcarbamoyladenosine(37)-N6)-methyltransferase TrmO [Candidatus Latescibacteria bacterium]|nr:tRNA (N6-threonylcarbamoyladenosine(37)-N6)-methyltransferase TrmO [Candidatus Latescibacterota bacterium]
MQGLETPVIGVIRSPFTKLEGMPIQSAGARDVEGTVEVCPECAEGLKDLDGFSHIYLIYWFHRAPRTELLVVPFLDTEQRGVFATRSPLRPSRIGLSIVELLHVEGRILTVRGVDILDGTPLLDIKPYVPEFDHRPGATSGWLKAAKGSPAQARAEREMPRCSDGRRRP